MRFDLRVFLAAVLLLGGVRCIGEMSSLSGSSCMTDLDCPGAYACVLTGLEGARTCQALTQQAAPPEEVIPGTPYYCKEIKPILDTYCNDCHGSNRTGSGIQTMRFDQYEDDDAEGVMGAKSSALRIRVRTSDFTDMPLKSFGLQPSDAERAAVKRWEAAGAPRCDDDPGVGSPDGGVDGGSIGGGGNDGGMTVPGPDAGVPNGTVSYASDVQPIWNAYCVGCHTANNQRGNLNLDPGVSRGELLNVASACNNQVVNVKASDPQGSMLWRKIMGDPSRCSAVMPTNGALNTFDAEAAKVVERWIQQGALNN